MDALAYLRKRSPRANTDLLREMVKVFAERLMSAEADALCCADYGERSEEQINRRNGYRERT
jgi:putative transposase